MMFCSNEDQMFGCHQSNISLVIFFICSIFLSLSVSADSSYQFSLSAYGADVEYDWSGEGEAYGLSAAAYIEPIKLDGFVPYTLAPYYSRTSGLFLGTSKSRVTDLNVIAGGRILKKFDGHTSNIGLRLAKEDLPLWLEFGYTRVGTSTVEFTSGKGGADRRYIKNMAVGWFINKNLSLYGFKEDDLVDSSGLGLLYLYNTKHFGFVEVGFQYTEIDSEHVDLEVVNGTIRNANVISEKEEIKAFSLTYYPTVKAEIGVRYELLDYNYDAHGNYLTINAGYFISSKLRLGISYFDVSQDKRAIRVGRNEYSNLSGSVSYKF